MRSITLTIREIVRLVLIGLLIFVLLLAGCSPTEEASATPETPESTAEPSSPVPTHPYTVSPSATPAPNATETVSIENTSSTEIASNPDEVFIVLRQEGGFAGLDDTWIVYQDGRIEKNGEFLDQLSSQELASLQDAIEGSGFFEIDHLEAGAFCCDFFTFTVSVTMDGKSHTISISDGDPELPSNIDEVLSLLLTSLSP